MALERCSYQIGEPLVPLTAQRIPIASNCPLHFIRKIESLRFCHLLICIRSENPSPSPTDLIKMSHTFNHRIIRNVFERIIPNFRGEELEQTQMFCMGKVGGLVTELDAAVTPSPHFSEASTTLSILCKNIILSPETDFTAK